MPNEIHSNAQYCRQAPEPVYQAVSCNTPLNLADVTLADNN